MKVRILPSAFGNQPHDQYLTTFLVDDLLAIDAGCLGLHAASDRTARLGHIFLTHAHVDHIATLPLFLDNGRDYGNGPVRVYGSEATLAAVREHFFNDRVWVGYSRLQGKAAWVELHAIEPEAPLAVGDFRITAVAVNHPVPTYGYIVDDGASACVFGGDSGPTDRIWEFARAMGRVRAVFLECSFPDSLEALATETGHLTPCLWAREVKKLPTEATAIAVHIKPHHRDRVVTELQALGGGRLQIGATGLDYSF